MNISKQLKSYRKEFYLSQGELAEIIKVSIPTIYNWENNNIYPDLHSLLLFGDYFKISLDELLKEDIVNMKNQLKKKEMNKLIYAIVLCVATLTALLIKYIGWYFVILFALLLAIAMYYSFKIEKNKSNYNLKTYQDILNYMENREKLFNLESVLK